MREGTITMQATKKSRRMDLRRFAGTRRGATIIALSTAGLAALALLALMSQYKRHVQDGTLQQTVLVADRLIPKGTSGAVIVSEGYFKPQTMSKDSVAGGAIARAADLRNKVSTRDVYPGEQLAAGEFASGADPIRGQLRGIQRAIAVPVNKASGLVGVLRAGDHVDVLAGFKDANGTSGRVRPELRTLGQDLLVLKAAAPPKGATGNDDVNIVVRADADLAAEIAYAAEVGTVWFTLRPPVGAKNLRPSAVTLEAILAGAPTITSSR